MVNRLMYISVGLVLAILLSVAVLPGGAAAQSASRDISKTLSRLDNNPRYQGRILGTHLRQDGDQFLYEVRILRPDDRIILVYIDPKTGGVVGDSERSAQRPPRQRDGSNRRQNDNPGFSHGFSAPLLPGQQQNRRQ